MEPMTALSVACNVLTIVDAAVNSSKTLWELYNSASGFTKETHRLVETTKQLQESLQSLNSARGQLVASQSPNSHIFAAAKQCDEISQAITAILAKCKVKEKSSISSAAKAWLKSKVKHRAELEDNYSKLQSASDGLRTALAIATR
jgi:Tfp pilus tip-associated adhesin PilY1